MFDTDTPDPLLKQVPLIKNPSFQPPRPVTLNADYAKLLSALPASIIPPKSAIGPEELEKWIADLQALEEKALSTDDRDKDIAKYKDWLAGVQRKVAPGFNFDIMTPTREDSHD